MATANYNLPTYKSGDIAGYLTMDGWNAAMEAIDTAIEGGGEAGIKKEQAVTYGASFEANSATSTITVPIAVAGITKISVFLAGGETVSGIEAVANSTENTSTDITVTLSAAPANAVSANVTVTKNV